MDYFAACRDQHAYDELQARISEREQRDWTEARFGEMPVSPPPAPPRPPYRGPVLPAQCLVSYLLDRFPNDRDPERNPLRNVPPAIWRWLYAMDTRAWARQPIRVPEEADVPADILADCLAILETDYVGLR